MTDTRHPPLPIAKQQKRCQKRTTNPAHRMLLYFSIQIKFCMHISLSLKSVKYGTDRCWARAFPSLKEASKTETGVPFLATLNAMEASGLWPLGELHILLSIFTLLQLCHHYISTSSLFWPPLLLNHPFHSALSLSSKKK